MVWGGSRFTWKVANLCEIKSMWNCTIGIYYCTISHRFATFHMKRGPPQTTSESVRNKIYYCTVLHRFATFHVKRGPPHTTSESVQSEVYYCTLPHRFATFHAKRGSPHTTSKCETKSIIVRFQVNNLLFNKKIY